MKLEIVLLVVVQILIGILLIIIVVAAVVGVVADDGDVFVVQQQQHQRRPTAAISTERHTNYWYLCLASGQTIFYIWNHIWNALCINEMQTVFSIAIA